MSTSSTSATPGIAFGFLSDGGALLVVGTALALLALVVFFATHTGRPLVWLPTGLLLGGAIGNLIDRARAGSVTDFVKFPHFPAFNVADMAITFGVRGADLRAGGPAPPREEAAAAPSRQPMAPELTVPAERRGRAARRVPRRATPARARRRSG